MGGAWTLTARRPQVPGLTVIRVISLHINVLNQKVLSLEFYFSSLCDFVLNCIILKCSAFCIFCPLYC